MEGTIEDDDKRNRHERKKGGKTQMTVGWENELKRIRNKIAFL